MTTRTSVTIAPEHRCTTGPVELPARLCTRLLRRAQDLHSAGLKGFGLLVGDPAAPEHPFRPVDVVLFDPRRNRRNEPDNQAAFHAQGRYFRRYDDAGFVADPADVLAAWRSIEDAGLEPVAPFHVHRRQPANFSIIDYRLHNPAFAWHLIISLRDPSRPVVQPFRVTKHSAEFGIDEHDGREGSELAYQGPEVEPLGLVATGSPRQVGALRRTLHPCPQPEPTTALAHRVTSASGPSHVDGHDGCGRVGVPASPGPGGAS